MGDEASSTAAHRAKRRRTDVPEAIVSRSSQEYGPREPSEPPQSPSVSGEGTEVEAGSSPQACADEPGPRDEELGTIDLQRYLTPSHQYRQPGHGDGERRRALEAAIQVAKRIAIMQPKPESLNRPLIERVNFYDPSMYLTAEFAHTIMDSKTTLGGFWNRNLTRPNREMWQCCHELLPRHQYKCVQFDIRGHGSRPHQSSGPWPNETALYCLRQLCGLFISSGDWFRRPKRGHA